jgi:ribonucleoside-diphosphate reductase alpha chain
MVKPLTKVKNIQISEFSQRQKSTYCGCLGKNHQDLLIIRLFGDMTEKLTDAIGCLFMSFSAPLLQSLSRTVALESREIVRNQQIKAVICPRDMTLAQVEAWLDFCDSQARDLPKGSPLAPQNPDLAFEGGLCAYAYRLRQWGTVLGYFANEKEANGFAAKIEDSLLCGLAAPSIGMSGGFRIHPTAEDVTPINNEPAPLYVTDFEGRRRLSQMMIEARSQTIAKARQAHIISCLKDIGDSIARSEGALRFSPKHNPALARACHKARRYGADDVMISRTIQALQNGQALRLEETVTQAMSAPHIAVISERDLVSAGDHANILLAEAGLECENLHLVFNPRDAEAIDAINAATPIAINLLRFLGSDNGLDLASLDEIINLWVMAADIESLCGFSQNASQAKLRAVKHPAALMFGGVAEYVMSCGLSLNDIKGQDLAAHLTAHLNATATLASAKLAQTLGCNVDFAADKAQALYQLSQKLYNISAL